MKAVLVLEDGTAFEGSQFGAAGETAGEVIFNTSMTGYQEILTDPSYKGQIVTMTYPLIGNYGTNAVDVESGMPQAEGLVVRELSGIASNFRATETLDEYLRRHGVVGIQGVDTRALTRRLRLVGAMNGIISSADLDVRSLVDKVKKVPRMEGTDYVKVVTAKEVRHWSEDIYEELELDRTQIPTPHYRVAAVDYGMKRNIARLLVHHGFEVTLVPATATAREISELRPQGIFLSNGPGDPAALGYAIETIRELLSKYPIFGICLGHQLMGSALGGRTFKLKFGHHGANQPVQDIETHKVSITSQNHGFAVDAATLDESQVAVTEINLNDRTVEGFRHRALPLFSVQYHPEASPGPHDTRGHFATFRKLVAESR